LIEPIIIVTNGFIKAIDDYSPNFKDVNLQACSAIIEEHPLCVFGEEILNRQAFLFLTPCRRSSAHENHLVLGFHE